MHYLLFYDLADDYLDRRPEFRGAHLKHAWAAQARGELVLAGALADPADQAVLCFAGSSKDDPYVKNGLVKAWRVRTWTTVVGDDAATPVRP